MAPILYRLRAWAWRRWRSAVALTLVVTIAGGTALFLLAGASRTITAPSRYSSWRGAIYDVTIEQSHGRPRTRELEGLPSTRRVDMATFVFGGLQKANADDVDALVFAGSHDAVGDRLVAGRAPDPRHPAEFVATAALAASSGLSVGDRLQLLTLSQHQADTSGFDVGTTEGPTLQATLVGLIDGPSEDDQQLAVFPATLLDQGDVGISASVGALSLRPGATRTQLRRELDQLPDPNAFGIEKADWVSSDIRAAVSAQGRGLAILALIVGAAAGVVLGQLLSRQLRLTDEERRALLALGETPRQIVGEPVWRAAAITTVGMLAATVLAYLASSTFPRGFVHVIEPHPGRRFDVLVHGIAPFVVVAALLGWVFATLLLEERPPKGKPTLSLGEKVAAAVPFAQAGVAVRFAFDSTARRTRAARTPLIGLVLVLSVLVGALTFGAQFRKMLDDPEEYGVNFDLAIGTGATEIAPGIVQGLTASDDVAALTMYGTASVRVRGTSLDVVAMQPVRGTLEPEVLEGRLPRGPNEVALGRRSARALGIEVGDHVKVLGDAGRLAMQVTGYVLVPPIGGVDSLGRAALVSQEGFAAIAPDGTMSAAGVRLAQGADGAARRRVAAIAGAAELGRTDPPAVIINLRRVRNIPFLVAGAVGALGVLSVSHLMVVAVRRRRRDLAILRAIGATPRWLSGVIHWQATITAACLLAVALPVGTAGGRSLARRFTDDAGTRPEAIIPLAWLGLTLVALVVLANLVAAVPARRARRVSAARTLAES